MQDNYKMYDGTLSFNLCIEKFWNKTSYNKPLFSLVTWSSLLLTDKSIETFKDKQVQMQNEFIPSNSAEQNFFFKFLNYLVIFSETHFSVSIPDSFK